ncbi:hypothetical protein [Pseudomonas sp. W2Jun17]|uniref:hypothetical protein n=1 Tax=Pseudomonas sp. W2Jun17 TaxID=1553460 RepID=UPI0020048FC9|nr:hypothetical protein [Pseudomonas sp. W2Jun17]MCK3851905.1 hypothetical protein [Pseudomonas sp. W2Jun17]
MELISLSNWDSSVADDVSYDVFVTNQSIDDRARFFASSFEGRFIQKIIIKNKISGSSFSKQLEDLGFVDVELSAFEQVLRCVDLDGKCVNVLLDISCMPRDVMSHLLSSILSFFSGCIVKIRIKYTIASYSLPPNDIGANAGIEAVHSDFSGWSHADSKPTSLVLGLGYEPFKAEGASEFFEPYDQWVFVPESPVTDYLPKVIENNQQLINRSEAENRTIYYKVDDPEMTFGQLEQVVSLLSKTTNPVLMPFGPKILFFLCLIQSLCHPEVGVWYVTGNHPEEIVNNFASEHSCGFECVFAVGKVD